MFKSQISIPLVLYLESSPLQKDTSDSKTDQICIELLFSVAKISTVRGKNSLNEFALAFVYFSLLAKEMHLQEQKKVLTNSRLHFSLPLSYSSTNPHIESRTNEASLTICNTSHLTASFSDGRGRKSESPGSDDEGDREEKKEK